MDFNFTKFERVKELPTDMTVYKTMVSIKGYDYVDVERVDVYLDNKKGAIKVVKGDTYKMSEFARGRHGFSSHGLIKEGLKRGNYTGTGNGIYLLKKNKKKAKKKTVKVPKAIVDPERGEIKFDKLKDYLAK